MSEAKLKFSEKLLVSATGQKPASSKIPVIAQPFVSERARKALDVVEKFVEEECIPSDTVYYRQLGQGTQARFNAHPEILEHLKQRAQELGLWNMFLPKNHFKEGAGYTNLEYGLMAEYLGKSRTASEACNCAAPDTGNMEVLAKYGTEAQKRRWLDPLLAGKIRSAFLMTEPHVASSDATNICLRIERQQDEYVLNGTKWWSSGAPDPRCSIYIVMGKTDPNNPSPYKQQSVVLVPADTPGITVHRTLGVFGYDDAPHGHGHITLKNVRVPMSNIILGPGRGFEVIQGRLGPGRIHHAMRSIGAAERALEYFLARATDQSKTAFGDKPLSSHGIMQERIARSRLEIDAARLVVLNAAITLDTSPPGSRTGGGSGAKHALKEIAHAKVLVPSMALTVIDRAIQAYGAAGVSQDTPLANMYAQGRTMRIVDGPDEVHVLQLGRNECKLGQGFLDRIRWQDRRAAELAVRYGVAAGGAGAGGAGAGVGADGVTKSRPDQDDDMDAAAFADDPLYLGRVSTGTVKSKL